MILEEVNTLGGEYRRIAHGGCKGGMFNTLSPKRRMKPVKLTKKLKKSSWKSDNANREIKLSMTVPVAVSGRRVTD